MSSVSEVANFFTDRSILITGGTGFLGKVLIEKLLRSVPALQRIYILIRPLKGVEAGERWRTLATTCPLFESIRTMKVIKEGDDQSDGSLMASVLDKVVPLIGDVTEPDLGLNADDLKLVCENVSVVFHCAASVRFDERMRLAVQMNVQGTQRLLLLCNRMKRLDAFVHASTAYCNCDREHILEAVYQAPVPWRRLLQCLEWMNDDMFDALTPYLLGAKPNSYTFTKAVAESMIADEEEPFKHLPIVIVRPSIVTASWREPFPGWIDNVNGATSFIALGAKGLLRSLYGDLHGTRADMIPVDIVANTLIVAAWHRASAKGLPMPVIHCTTGSVNPAYWGQLIPAALAYFIDEMPLLDLYRMPGGKLTKSKTVHRLRMFFDHLVPAYITDCMLKISGRRPMMVRAYGKITKVLTTLEYFYTRQWIFDSNAITAMNDQLSDTDRNVFNMNVKDINWPAYLREYSAGVRKFIFKEDPSNVLEAKKALARRRMIDNFVQFTFILFGCLLMLYFFY